MAGVPERSPESRTDQKNTRYEWPLEQSPAAVSIQGCRCHVTTDSVQIDISKTPKRQTESYPCRRQTFLKGRDVLSLFPSIQYKRFSRPIRIVHFRSSGGHPSPSSSAASSMIRGCWKTYAWPGKSILFKVEVSIVCILESSLPNQARFPRRSRNAYKRSLARLSTLSRFDTYNVTRPDFVKNESLYVWNISLPMSGAARTISETLCLSSPFSRLPLLHVVNPDMTNSVPILCATILIFFPPPMASMSFDKNPTNCLHASFSASTSAPYPQATSCDGQLNIIGIPGKPVSYANCAARRAASSNELLYPWINRTTSVPSSREDINLKKNRLMNR